MKLVQQTSMQKILILLFDFQIFMPLLVETLKSVHPHTCMKNKLLLGTKFYFLWQKLLKLRLLVTNWSSMNMFFWNRTCLRLKPRKYEMTRCRWSPGLQLLSGLPRLSRLRRMVYTGQLQSFHRKYQKIKLKTYAKIAKI